MKQIITAPALAIMLTVPLAVPLSAPLAAQEAEGFNLMEEGAKLFLRGLMTEMEPALEDFESLAEDIGPAMRGVADELAPMVTDIIGAIDDIQYYREFEVLENGDILIRRSPLAPPFGEEQLGDDLPGSGVIDAPQIEL